MSVYEALVNEVGLDPTRDIELSLLQRDYNNAIALAWHYAELYSQSDFEMVTKKNKGRYDILTHEDKRRRAAKCEATLQRALDLQAQMQALTS